MQYFYIPSNKFVARKPEYPAVTLEVELKSVSIEYTHSFKPDDTEEAKRTEGHFRVVADLSGNVQAVQGGVPFQDVSEISAALLTPVFDYLR